jgi:hypothetical protein
VAVVVRPDGADAIFWNNGPGGAGFFVVVAMGVFGAVGAVASMASFGVPAVVAARSLGLSEVDAADAVVWDDGFGVSEAVILGILVTASGSERAGERYAGRRTGSVRRSSRGVGGRG